MDAAAAVCALAPPFAAAADGAGASSVSVSVLSDPSADTLRPPAPSSSLDESPPPALARFATTAPPTEPALRLGFEDALRQARAAAQEGTLPRLNSLLTIRRGEDVVWGDATEANVERARRALEAGDVEGALGHLGRLPESLRQGMRAWLEEAQALAQARFALRALAGG